MGDSVLTEILARHQRGALPEYFNTFFQTVTFTNGGMVYDLINKRLSQVTQCQLLSRYVESLFRFCSIHGWAQSLVQSHVDWMAQVWEKNLADVNWGQSGVQVIKMRRRSSLTWPIWTPSTNTRMENVSFIKQFLI